MTQKPPTRHTPDTRKIKMPHYLLSIKAELTHVKSFRLSDGARFCVDLTSGSETRSDVWLDPAILVEAPVPGVERGQ